MQKDCNSEDSGLNDALKLARRVENDGVVASAALELSATHIVLYKKSETKLKELDGRVACKLTADNYGRSEWWLLLEPVEC